MVDAGSIFGSGGVKAGDNLRYVEKLLTPSLVSLDVSARISGNAAGIFVGDSGNKMYIADNTNNRIDQYTLSTPNSLVGAVYASKTHSDASLESNGLFFRPDGTKVFYIFNSGTLSVKEVTLGTPWDISTGGASATFAINSQISTAFGLAFSSDGTKMYVLDASASYIEQYTLGTPWSIATASYASKRLFYRYFNSANWCSILFNTAGTEVTVISKDQGTSSVTYTLSTPWDISTGTFTRNGVETATASTLLAVCWSSNGLKLFTISQDQTAREYAMDTAYIASQKVTIFSYTGKATLLGLSVKQLPGDSAVSTSTQNSMVYCNVDSAGDRLIGSSTFQYLVSTELSLSEPKAFTGCIARSKTTLVIKAEARSQQIVEARYSIE